MFEAVAELILRYGAAAAPHIQRAYGGESLYIPVEEDDGIKRRNEKIRAAADSAKKKGRPLPISKLMSEHELSRRQIFNILGET